MLWTDGGVAVCAPEKLKQRENGEKPENPKVLATHLAFYMASKRFPRLPS